MSEVVEISSDSSSDTIVTPPEGEDQWKNTSFENAFSVLNEIDGLLKKYNASSDVTRKDSGLSSLEKYNLSDSDSGPFLSQHSSPVRISSVQVATECSPCHSKQSKYYLSDSEDDVYVPLEKRLNSAKSNSSVIFNECSLGSVDAEASSESSGRNSKDDSQNSLQTESQPKRRRKVPKENQDAERHKKLQEKQQKKEELQREKAMKQALQNANRNLKPDQAMRFIKVHLDSNIIKSDFCADIKVALDNLDIAHNFRSQRIPDVITWTRCTQSQIIDDNGKLALSDENIETDELLLIMDWRKLVELVSTTSLVSHMQSIKSAFPKKKLCLGIVGLQRYYNYLRNVKRKDFRVGMTEAPQGNVKDSTLFKDAPRVSKQQIETLLTELQILCNLSCRRLDTNQDVGLFVAQFSKAVAQLPYKLEKQKKHQEANWYMSGDNKDCVKVDKDGNGLNRLWHQQLTTFPLARLETAEAIASKYPTPAVLMQSYDECINEEGAQSLLQEIPIRRCAGPLTSVRKIGPEMSRRIYKFFTSLDGETLL